MFSFLKIRAIQNLYYKSEYLQQRGMKLNFSFVIFVMSGKLTSKFKAINSEAC